ncbi:MAG: hypothetical protein KDK62_01570 [Chlamydiia bacterium]|nr:hypothetical protein [Chlamydiia bacterium]
MANPNEEILRALNHLEAYTEMASRNVSRFEEIKDRIQWLFFSEYREEKTTQELKVQKELIKSIGLIKQYLPLIEKYKKGSEEERKFANTVIETIERYNQTVENKSTEDAPSKLKIDWTRHIAHIKSGDAENKKTQKIFFSRSLSKVPPSQLEKDTLKMKAIRMIETDPDFQESLLETLKDSDAGINEEIESDGNMVKLMQTWSALPGEVHRIIGSFRRESERSIPIKDSFQVFLESKQTGHPYPAQHMGWALSHWLIPASAIWIDHIPLLEPLLKRKKQLAEELLPKGKKNLKARNLFRLKKQLFEEGRLEFLTFHQELSHAIVLACPNTDETTNYRVINHFFEQLIQEPSPFLELSKVNEELNHIFIDVPYEIVEELRLQGAQANLFDRLDKEFKTTAEVWDASSSETTPYDKAKKAYLKLMGFTLGHAALLLLKLHLSEKLKLKPPPLSDFELKVQAAAYKHLIEFLEEMEEPAALSDPHEHAALKLRMKMEVQSEIELFSAPSFEDIDPFLQELVEETVGYFHARWHSSD